MGEKINDQVAGPGTGVYDARNGFERFLCVAARNVFFQAIENLLNVYPDIAGTNVSRFAPFYVLCFPAIYRFVVTPQNLRDVRVLNLKVGRAFDVVKEFLTHSHPVFLRAIPSLVSHGNKTAGHEVKIPHHDHEIGQWLKMVVLIGPEPDV